ncbi:COBRA-like protein 6 [Impatiens glandulifera]|uniref:COBRA-like protein 6 n=1 Tax=Impatiens glandulifera TaxID=253017 RepID=UPI001FB14394|nr:COBRA-like protein 6 [Impatiens glandulifera]
MKGPFTLFISVSILNNQLYRHIEAPGWKLRWDWQGNEIIWKMMGAETTEQGDCSKFNNVPYCCLKKPIIIDLLPGTPFNNQFTNCCKGGVLSSLMQGPGKYGSAFLMKVGGIVGSTSSNDKMHVGVPLNFSLGLSGYSCGNPFRVAPTIFYYDNGRRTKQAAATYNVTCTYSQFLSSPSPKCCVSLSAFYNDTIIPCPSCSCGCPNQVEPNCVKNREKVKEIMQVPTEALVECTRHMCPIRVHWHIKVNYKEYWRVKLTVTNMNYVKNYSQWNLVVLHPNLRSLTQVFSFNYQPLNQFGNINDTGMFYGIEFYNDILLQSGENGNVQTEMLLNKENGNFTFGGGWAFPRRISFNGDECVMPSPDDYPTLPNKAELILSSSNNTLLISFWLLLIMFF